MTHPHPVTQNGSHTARDVDGLLHDYFRAQMPVPWPELDVPATLPLVKPRSRWLRAVPRLALAASILLLVFGYLALAGLFPQQSAISDAEDLHRNIGHKAKRVTTPAGREALINEEVINGDRPTIIINLQQLSGPQK